MGILKNFRPDMLSAGGMLSRLNAGFIQFRHHFASVSAAIGNRTASKRYRTLGLAVGALIVSSVTALNSSAATAQVATQTPVVSIRAVENSATEGAAILFNISASPRPDKEIALEFDAELSGDFGVVFNPNAVLTPENPAAFVVVLTKDDKRVEPDGSVALSIRAAPETADYEVADFPDNTAQVQILDNDRVGEDLAVISVKPESNFVEEGAAARFVFYSSKPVDEPIVVNVAQEGNFIDEYYDCYTIEMVRGETTASLNILTVDDRFFENNGRITVSLQPSRHYNLSRTGKTASVVIVDNDHKERFTQNLTKSLATSSNVVPAISIEAVNSTTLAEGEFGEFRIAASAAPTKNLPILVSVYELDSDIYKGREIRHLDLPALADSVPFALETAEDNVAGSDGKIVLTILPGKGYSVGSAAQISVQTLDSGIGAAPVATEASIVPAELPAISIATKGRNSIKEGQTASFQLTASLPPQQDLAVNLFVSDGEGDFLKTVGTNTVTFPFGQTLAHLDLPTVDDGIVEPDGSIVVALTSGHGYQLGRSIGGIVEILDNDKTSVNNSVFGCGSKIDAVADGPVPVIEIDTVPFSQIGSITQFRIQASVTVETDMTVNLDLSGGDATGELNFAISVPLLKGEQVTTFFFPTEGQGSTSSSNELSARVATNTNYIVSETNEIATTQLLQHDANTPVLAIQASADSITEGENAEFLLVAREVVRNQMEVLIEFKERKGGWNYDTFVESVAFPSGGRTLPVVLTTEIDDEYFGDGEIIATVLTGRSYRAAKLPENSARIKVRSDGVPVVSVTSLQQSGDEGSRFGFEFAVNPVPRSQLTVALNVSQIGNFLANATGSEELASGRSTLAFSPNTGTLRMYVRTDNDSELEADGSIEVSILVGAGYRSSPSSESARVAVFDNDAPRLSLTSLSNTPRTEGEHLEFEILASRAVQSNLQVNLEVSEAGSSYAVETTSTRTLPTHGEKVTFTIPTVDDDVDEKDDLVTVSLLPGAGYNVASAAYYASVQVADNDDPRQITIESAADTVYEGEPAVFRIQASEDTRREIGLYVDGGRGNFLIDSPPTSIFVEGSSPVVLSIPTEDDEVDESDEYIIVNILPGEGYLVFSETGSAAVHVLDDDEPPLISIDSGLDEIFEGDAASFVLTSSHSAHRTVNVGISDGGKGILGELDQTLRIEFAGQTSQLVTVPTIDNELYQPNGNITAIVLSSDNYEVAGHPNNIATIRVLDNDTATAYSIEPVEKTVQEGSTIRFKIESRGLAGVVAPIEVAQVGDFIRGQPPTSIRIERHGLTYFEIATDNDNQFEANGSVTASLNLRGENISVLGGRSQATVEILDNDIPEISLRSSQAFVELHKGITFTAVASGPLASNLRLRLKISDIGETFAQEKFVNLTIPAGQTGSNKASYIVPQNDVFQFDRRIVAELVANPSYKIKRGNGEAVVRVVGSNTPEISIESIAGASKFEGSAFDFRLHSSIAISRPLKVKVGITTEGGFLAANSERIIVLASDESQVDFQVQSLNNGASEGDGSITVAVLDGSGYDLTTDSSARSATVVVLDSEPALVSIHATATEVSEGDPILLELASTKQSDSDMEITVQVAASGNIVDSSNLGNTSHTLTAGQRSLSFSIATLENQINGPDRTVRVAVQNGAGYQASATNGSVTVTVADDDLPVLSIAAVANSVNEGSPAQFVISSSSASESVLTVRYSVTQTGNVLQDTTRLRTVQLRNNSQSTTIEIATRQDDVDEVNGTVTVSLEEDSNNPARYGIGANSARRTTVDVLDDDLPEFTISAISTDVLEGDIIQLTLSSVVAVASDLNIAIIVSGDVSYINSTDAGRQTLTVSANRRFVTHRITTLENQQINDDGEITVEIQAGAGYLVAAAPANSTSITILDDDLFEMSITALAATKNEGESVDFVISSTNAPDSPITLKIKIIESSTHPVTKVITSATTDLLQVFPSGQTRLALARETTHDGVHGTDTLMTLEIRDGTGYDVAQARNKASTTVKNIDIPEISIQLITSSINPGQTQTDFNNISLESTIQLGIPLNVGFEVTVTDSTTGTTSDSQFAQVVEPASGLRYQIPIGTRHSAKAGDSVAITLLSGTGYKVSATEQQVSFTVGSTGTSLLTNSLAPEPIRTPTVYQNVSRQEVNLPILSIAADAKEVSEGGKARFRISATRASTEDLTVNLTVVQTGGEFISGAPSETLVLEAGNTIAVLDIDIIGDNAKQNDRVLSVSIRNGQNYDIAAAPADNDSVTISDNESLNRTNRIQNLNMEIIPNSLASLGTGFADSLLLRINQAFNNEISDTPSLNMGGDNTILDVLQYQAQELGDSTNTWASLLEESSVHYTMFTDSELVMPITVWGNSDYYFKTEDNGDDSMDEDGEVYNVFMGFDAHHRTGIVGGAAVNQFVSDLDYRGGSDESIQGTHQNQLTGVHPYLGWVSQLRNMRVWSSAGFGQGNVVVEELENEKQSLPSTYRMFSVNSENHFLNLEDGFSGNVNIELRNEAWSVQQAIDGSSIGLDDDSSSFDAYRIRSALHGDHQLVLSEEASLHTEMTTGLHWQGGTSGDYFRIEVGTDFSSEIPYGFSVYGHSLLLFGSSVTFEEQALNGGLNYDDEHDGLGLIVDVSSSIGDSKQGNESASEFWRINFTDNAWNSATPWEDKQFEVRFAYGLQVFDENGVLTPYNRVVLRNQGRHEFRIGHDMTVGADFSTSLEGFVSLLEDKNDLGISSRYNYSW